jgi:hypothetical protein
MPDIRGKPVLEIGSVMSLIEVAAGKRCFVRGRSGLQLELLLLLELEAEDKLLRRAPRLSRLRREEDGDLEYSLPFRRPQPVRPLSLGV